MSFLPSEESIKNKLLELCRPAPALFQKIAEDFLSLRDPARYRGLRPQGRNALLQTTKGYPDSYSIVGSDVHLVEVTTGDWRGHLEKEDAVRIKRIRRAASYVLLVLSDAEQLIPQKNTPEEKKQKDEAHYRELLCGLGLPKERIELIFLDQLVRELRSPRYSRLLRDIGVLVDVSPYVRLSDLPSTDPTAPNRDEYANGLVVAQDKLKSAWSALQKGNALLLVGGGGSGKTTLGLAIAHHWYQQKREDAFRLDLRDFSAAAPNVLGSLLSVLDSYRGSRALFVIDNLHLLPDSEQARLLRLAAERTAPRVVFTSRTLPENLLSCMDSAARGRISVQAVTVTEADLLVAYNRLAARQNLSGHVPQPGDHDIRAWLQAAPDLLLFTRSIAAQTRELRAGMLPIVSKERALASLRENYLEALPANERTALIGIAKLASLEVAASQLSLGEVEPKTLVARQLILPRSVPGKPERTRYFLPHDNLGALLLECFDSEEVESAWAETISRDVHQAAFIARRLLERHAHAEARSILAGLRDQIWTFTESLPPSYAGIFDELYQAAELPTDHRDGLIAAYQNFVLGHSAFLAGAATLLEFAERIGLAIEPIVQQMSSQSEARLRTALRLADPQSIADLLATASRLDASFYELLWKNLAIEECLHAFANNFVRLSANEADHVLLTLERAGKDAHRGVTAFLSRGDRLRPLFESVTAPLTQRSDYCVFLRRRRLVELLAASPCKSALAERVAKSHSYVETLAAAKDGPGPHTRSLLSVAVAQWSPAEVFRAPTSKTARTFADCLLGVEDEQVLRRLLLGPPQRARALILHWRPSLVLRVWRQLTETLSAKSNVLTEFRAEATAALQQRIDKALAGGHALPLAALWWTWHEMGIGPLHREGDMLELWRTDEARIEQAARESDSDALAAAHLRSSAREVLSRLRSVGGGL